MKKRIIAGILAFIFATLIATEYVYLVVQWLIMEGQTSDISSLILIGCFGGVGLSGAALAVAGGVLAILRKKKGFLFMWAVTQIAAYPIALVMTLSGILSSLSGFVKILAIVVGYLPIILGCVFLILAEKPKNTMAYIAELINFCSSMSFFIYSLFYLGSGFAAGFAILGLIGCLFMNIAIARAERGLASVFELTLLSGVCQASQFVVILTACGILGNAYFVLIGMMSVILTSVGAILIADNLESGFVLLSFGIISFVILLSMIGTIIGSAFAIITLIATLGLVVQVAETLKMRVRENDKITKSI